MPMWATGSEPPCAPVRGLSLLEVMVVMAVLAIAASMASLAFRTPGAAEVEEEALRLAALLEAARAQSRRSGLPVRWQVAPQGFHFDGLPGPALPQDWKHAGMAAQVQDGEVLLLGPEPVIAAQRVLILSTHHPSARWQVATDGVRPFQAEPAPAPP